MFKLSYIALLYLAQFVIAQPAPSAKPADEVKPEDKCKLSGQVLSASTNEGVRKANLSLQGPGGNPTFTATTGAEDPLSSCFLLSAIMAPPRPLWRPFERFAMDAKFDPGSLETEKAKGN